MYLNVLFGRWIIKGNKIYSNKFWVTLFEIFGKALAILRALFASGFFIKESQSGFNVVNASCIWRRSIFCLKNKKKSNKF